MLFTLFFDIRQECQLWSVTIKMATTKVDFKYNKRDNPVVLYTESLHLQSDICQVLLSSQRALKLHKEAGFLLYVFFYLAKSLQADWVIWLLPNI